MIKPITVAVIGLCVATAPAFAQTSSSPKSAAECQQIWQSADANRDNMLSMNELVNMASANTTTGSTTGSTTGTTGSTTMGSADTTTGSTTGTTGSTTMGSADTTTTGSTTGTTGTTTGSTTAGSAAGMMVSQQDFMTACTTGQ